MPDTPLYYAERLIQDNGSNCHLTRDNNFTATYSLSEALNGFCNGCKGLHICIVCTDILPRTPIDQALITEAFNMFTENGYQNLTEDITDDFRSGNYVSVDTEHYYYDVLKKIEAYLKKLNKKTDNANPTIEYCKEEEEGGYLKDFCKRIRNAERVTAGLISKEELRGAFADIKVIFFLPKSFYELFSSKECFFLGFIEYIILALSPTDKIKRYYEEKLQSKDKEIETLKKALETKENNITKVVESLVRNNPILFYDTSQKVNAEGLLSNERNNIYYRRTPNLKEQLDIFIDPQKDASLNERSDQINNNTARQKEKTDTEKKSNSEDSIIPPSKDNGGR